MSSIQGTPRLPTLGRCRVSPSTHSPHSSTATVAASSPPSNPALHTDQPPLPRPPHVLCAGQWRHQAFSWQLTGSREVCLQFCDQVLVISLLLTSLPCFPIDIPACSCDPSWEHLLPPPLSTSPPPLSATSISHIRYQGLIRGRSCDPAMWRGWALWLPYTLSAKNTKNTSTHFNIVLI